MFILVTRDMNVTIQCGDLNNFEKNLEPFFVDRTELRKESRKGEG